MLHSRDSPQHSRKPLLRDSGSVAGGIAGLVVVTLAVIAVLALAFGLPWLRPAAQFGTTLERYLPLNDGAAVMLALYGPNGDLIGRRSANVRVLSDSRAITTDLRQAYRDALKRYNGARARRHQLR